MSQLRQQCGFTKKDVVLFYHGIMHQGKGLDILLEWTASLFKKDRRLGIILVGSGPEEQRLKQLAIQLGIGDRTHFAGWVKTVREIGDYCNAADISVAMRTATEANDRVVPGALVHSMACRKVVIGPRLSGISEIIRHGENGFMFTPDDGEDFERLIMTLVSDRAAWETIACNAYQDVVDQYSVDAAAKQYAEALRHFATTPE
jgi:glycosyltransferase involved in cell wall biosynthesis